jgi:hypothetical protein
MSVLVPCATFMLQITGDLSAEGDKESVLKHCRIVQFLGTFAMCSGTLQLTSVCLSLDMNTLRTASLTYFFQNQVWSGLSILQNSNFTKNKLPELHSQCSVL